MSSFYTNIQLAGDTILYRGYEDGEAVQYRTSFSPTLYVLSKKKEKFKTLDGRNVAPVKFQNAREARDFIKKYEGVDNLKFMDTSDSYTNTFGKSLLKRLTIISTK